jgi:multiple sugar transport system ATP-binding protein
MKSGSDGAWFEPTGGGRLKLAGGRSVSGSIEAGIRPEHFIVGGNGAVDLRVDVVEPTGSETHVYGAIGNDAIRAVFRDRIAVKPGDRLPVSVAPGNIHLFDTATGLPL